MKQRFSQQWDCRAECLADIAHFTTADWHTAKVHIESMQVKRIAEWRPDMRVSLALVAPTSAQLRLGLCHIVDQLLKKDDVHVMIESLKPASSYDGNRNGPFATKITRPNMATFMEMKARSDANLTDHEKEIAKKRAHEILSGERADLLDKARDAFRRGARGTACGAACVAGRRVGNIRSGVYVGCGFCEACLALKQVLSAELKKAHTA